MRPRSERSVEAPRPEPCVGWDHQVVVVDEEIQIALGDGDLLIHERAGATIIAPPEVGVPSLGASSRPRVPRM